MNAQAQADVGRISPLGKFDDGKLGHAQFVLNDARFELESNGILLLRNPKARGHFV